MKRLSLTLLLTLCIVATGLARTVTEKVEKRITAITVDAPVDVNLCRDAKLAGTITYSTSATRAPLQILRRATGELIIKATSEYSNNRKFPVTAAVTVYYDSDLAAITTTSTADISADAITTYSNLKITTAGTGDVKIKHLLCSQKNLELKSTGTGDIDIKSLVAKNLTATTSGTGDIEIDQAALNGYANLTASGTGDIEIAGNAATGKFNACGTGDIKAQKLQLQQLNVTNNSVGNVKCRASKQLTAKVSTIGKVSVHGGRPASVNISGEEKQVVFKK
jgi:hypothetical protein